MRSERLALLGSTGSIGEQAIEVARASAGRFEIAVLTAARNWERLAAQARELMPDSVVIADKQFYPSLKEALADLPIKVYAGNDAISQVAAGGGVDVVLNALVGYAGLEPTVAAVTAGKRLALANKESLVVAGELVMRLALERQAPILPVDSEHSAVLQCLAGELGPASRLILTASGGPFLHTPAEELPYVTVQQALRHPNWSMGSKITIDSATMVNKGFEVIEARWLFDIPADRIDVVIHPQSVIHSMVEMADGSIKAQLGKPDMKLPIQYALTFPERIDLGGGGFDFGAFPRLDFLPVDGERFPAVELARECLRRGGLAGCVMNASNEVAVAAFLEGRIPFTGIVETIERTLSAASAVKGAPTMDDYRASDDEARRIARQITTKL